MAESTIRVVDYRDLSDVKSQEEREQILAETIQALYAEYKDAPARKAAIERIQDGRAAYEQKCEEVTTPWPKASNRVGPITLIAVDSLEPTMLASTIGTTEIVRADSFNDDETVKKVVRYDNHWLRHEVKVDRRMADAMHDLGLDGTWYGEIGWRLDEETHREFIPATDPLTGLETTEYEQEKDDDGKPTGKLATQDFQVTKYEGGFIDLLPFEDVFTPDNVDDEDWEKVPTIIRRRWTFAELKRRATTGEIGWRKPKDSLKEKMAAADDQKDTTVIQKEGEVKFSKIDKGIKCLEAHMEFDIDGDGEPERIIAAVPQTGSKDILRLAPLLDFDHKGRKRIRRMRIGAKRGCSYGWSIPSLVAGIQEGFDRSFRLIQNCAHIQLVPFIMGDLEAAGFEDDQPMIAPGGSVTCKHPEHVQLVRFPGEATQFLPMLQEFLNLLERIISAPDYTSGNRPEMGVKPSMGTATGTMALLAQGNLKHDYRGKSLQQQFMEMIIEPLHDLYYQNMPLTVAVADLGPDFLIHKQEMGRPVRLSLMAASSTSNQFIDQQNTEHLLAAVKGAGLSAMMNPERLARDLLESHDKHNPEQYIDPTMNQIIGLATKLPPQGKAALAQFAQQAAAKLEQMAQASRQGGAGAPQTGAPGPMPPGQPAPPQQQPMGAATA